MDVSDSMLLEWCRETGLPYDYLESIARGGYFHDVGEVDLPRHLALISLTYDSQQMALWK